MCLLIFIRISAATNSCNFTEILKAQKLKNSRSPSSNKIFFNCFAPLGFGIAEYNDQPIIKKKKKNMGGGGWEGLSRKMDANPGK